MPTADLVRTEPRRPPAHPAFQPFIRSIAVSTERHGARATARMVREKVELMGERADPDSLLRSGVTAIELTDLMAWAMLRASELEGRA
jgi:hypothetical protein